MMRLVAVILQTVVTCPVTNMLFAELYGHLESQPKVKQGLSQIKVESLGPWLDIATKSPAGRDVLVRHLSLVFERNPDKQLSQLADRLLSNDAYRISHAMVRSDLYLNWRCACRGSIRDDLPDDTYHVL
jgi:hypothetical protein